MTALLGKRLRRCSPTLAPGRRSRQAEEDSNNPSVLVIGVTRSPSVRPCARRSEAPMFHRHGERGR